MSTDGAESQDDRLARLFALWEARAAGGEEVTAADICPDDPETAADLERLGRMIRAVRSAASPDRTEPPALPPGSTVPEPAEAPEVIPAVQAEPLPRVPGYEVARVLGRGGMGVVYLARDLTLKRDVALKMIAPSIQPGEDAERRFAREAELAARLRHGNIVQIYDFGTADGRSYFAQEYIPGGTLAARWGTSPQPPYEAAEILRSVALAVHSAHEAGVLHRDLKPQNILLDEHGTPKVADFGLARPVDAGLTISGLAIGTPEYMSPEQARGDGNKIGPRSDVYSLGCMLFRGLTGRPPFRGETPWQTVRILLEADPPPSPALPGSVPRDLAAVCLKCLEREPEDRYSTAAELAEELARFLAEEAVLARPIGPARRMLRRMRRPVGLRIAADLAAAYGVIGFAWSLFAMALIGTAFQPKRPAELVAMLALPMFGDYLPTIALAVATRRNRRRWAFPTALSWAGLRVVLQVACLVGYSPSFGGIYDDAVVRTAVYAFLILMTSTVLAAHVAAIPAYLSTRPVAESAR